MSVGSICVCGRALVRVTSRSFPTAAAAAAAPAPETFLRARTFCFLNKVQFSTLSAQSAGVSLKMGCESGKFMARKIEHLLLLKVALKCIPIWIFYCTLSAISYIPQNTLPLFSKSVISSVLAPSGALWNFRFFSSLEEYLRGRSFYRF